MTTATTHHRRPPLRPALRTLLLVVFVVLGALGHPANAGATSPGENGLIAFSASTDNGIQLFTVRPNGEDLRQITHVAGDATNVDWSPNGRRIVFSLGDETSARIAIARADGSRLRVLPQPEGVFDDQPSFHRMVGTSTSSDTRWRRMTTRSGA